MNEDEIDAKTLSEINNETMTAIRTLHSLRKKEDAFDEKAEESISNLRERGFDVQANILQEYVDKNPAGAATADAISARNEAQAQIETMTMDAWKAQHQETIAKMEAEDVDDYDTREVKFSDVSARMAQEMEWLQEILSAITPEYLAEKFDEQLEDPETIKQLEDAGYTPEQVAARKDEFIGQLHESIQKLSDMSEFIEKFETDAAEASEGLPALIQQKLQEGMIERMNAAQETLKGQFNDKSDPNQPDTSQAIDAAVQALEDAKIKAAETEVPVNNSGVKL